jgi:hypothetical protein
VPVPARRRPCQPRPPEGPAPPPSDVEGGTSAARRARSREPLQDRTEGVRDTWRRNVRGQEHPGPRATRLDGGRSGAVPSSPRQHDKGAGVAASWPVVVADDAAGLLGGNRRTTVQAQSDPKSLPF